MQTITTHDLWALTKSCAANIYGHTAPTPAYASRVARLLAGTCAAESQLIYRRQIGFGWRRDDGAWGLWQTERAAVQDSTALLARRDDIARRAAHWLTQDHDADLDFILARSPNEMLRWIAGWDRLACLFARLHYMRVPSPVPDSTEDQAAYWKRYYNTTIGKGTVPEYLSRYRAIL